MKNEFMPAKTRARWKSHGVTSTMLLLEDVPMRAGPPASALEWCHIEAQRMTDKGDPCQVVQCAGRCWVERV